MVAAQPQTSINHIAILAIPLRTIGNDKAIYVARDTVLVASQSEPGAFRLVNLAEGICSCPGHFHRGTCRHLTVAKVCEQIEEREAVPVLNDRCECGEPWTVKVDGKLFCGACSPRPQGCLLQRIPVSGRS